MADNALKLAEAERERRRRQAQVSSQQQPAQPPSPGMRAYLGEATAGIASPLASAVDFIMSPVAAGYEMVTGEPARGLSTIIPQAGAYTPDGGTTGTRAVRRAGEFIGMALPTAASIPRAASMVSQIPSARQSVEVAKNIFNDISRTAMQAPGRYFGAETLAAGGAGAAGQLAQEAGATPEQRLAAELGGAFAGGIPAAIPGTIRSFRDAVLANLAPFTREGGSIRAARQMQQRAGGPERAAQLAGQLENIPSGVTPAQWIGDEVLMAQESRLLADNPDLAPRVQAELQEARLAAQEALQQFAGQPRSRQQWEAAVLQRVTPEGAKIEGVMTDEMLDSAYQSFRPLYDSAKGFEIQVPNSTESMQGFLSSGRIDKYQPGLQRILAGSAFDDAILATPESRNGVARWLDNQYGAYKNMINNGRIDSGAIIDLRSTVRDERRKQMRRGNMEWADLLGSAEANLTSVLMKDLPEQASRTLRAADSQYRKYKIVENAIFNAGDSALTPQQLSESIRTGGLTTPAQYARGQDPAVQELRELALAGRSTEEVIGDPRRASLFVRGLDDAGKQAVQADFINVLYNRAKAKAPDVTQAGTALISGRQLIRDIAENEAVLLQLGMDRGDVGRLKNMANEVSRLGNKPAAALQNLFEDGPATLLQLGATLIGAKQGQRLAGGGMGSSLVLAQYMSNRARNTLARLTSNQAEQLMKDAVTDPRLYKALLIRPTSTPAAAKESAKYLEGWLLASAADSAISEE